MQLRELKASGATLVTLGLSVGLLLACGDDAESSDGLSKSDGGEHSSHRNAADATVKSSEGTGGSSTKGGTNGDSTEASGDEKPTERMDSSDEDGGVRDDTAGDGRPTPDAQPKSMKVSIRFKAKVGEEDFACGRKYAGQGTGNTTVTPRDLRTFVHDVALIRADGTKVAVSLNARAPWQSESLALLDFEDNTGRCAKGTAEVNTVITGTIAAGSYKGISFVSGVPEALNHKDPLMADDPLKSAASLHLSPLEGFRFAKIELVQPTAPGEPFGMGLFQPNSTQCTRNETDGVVTCAKPNRNLIKLDAFDVEKNSIVMDIGRLFSRLDLRQAQECNSTQMTCESMFDAFGVDYATGKPKDTQALFRVE